MLNGSGIVYCDGLSMIVFYKDDNGCIKKFFVVCIYLGGIVYWNLVEKFWDCFCYGLCFLSYGDVLEGLVIEGFKKIVDEKNGRDYSNMLEFNI